TPEIYTLSLHDALPISDRLSRGGRPARRGPRTQHRPPAPGDRHGLPALQPLPAPDRARKHHRGADPRPRDAGGGGARDGPRAPRSEEHTSELQSPYELV